MLIGVVGVVAIALGNSVAADMLIAQEEQLNGREASFETEFKVPDGEVFVGDESTGTTIYDELKAATSPDLKGLVVELSLPARLATPREAKDSIPGTAITTQWLLGDVTATRRMPLLAGAAPQDGCYPGGVMLNEAAASSVEYEVGRELVLTMESIYQPRMVRVSAIVADGQTEPRLYGSWEMLNCSFVDLASIEGASVHAVALPSAFNALQQVVAGVASRHGLELNGGLRRVDTVESVRGQIETLSLLFGVCAGLLLAVSAMGIANVGIASVAERSRELVVRRAFGARRMDIFVQVIAGAVIVGVGVGLIAFVLAIAGTYLAVPALIPVATSIVSPPFPWVAGLIGVLAALVTSVIGGLVPAIKATRIDVARALRD